MMITNKRLLESKAGLYIHIPFCMKKCYYCGFLSFDHYQEKDKQAYIDALLKELAMYGEKKPKIDTIFLGGGTPSILSEDQMEQIMKAVINAFDLGPGSEITIETNPKTLTERKLKAYRQLGINRLSLGVQSLDDTMLSGLGRVHTRQDVIDNYQMVRQTGFDNINVDLMFGIPGQNMTIWKQTLKEAIALKPEHISFYSLQLEEGTPFYNNYRLGQMDLVSNQEEGSMYHVAVSMLKEAGYNHYEISNCALPSYECRHNLKYWSFEEYYGVGLGAHGFLHEEGRWYNQSTIDEYMGEIKAKRLPATLEERSLKDAMAEYVFTALRKTEGLNTEDFHQTFGRDFYQVYKNSMDSLFQYKLDGSIILNQGRLALTEKGIDGSNEIMAEFV